MSIPVNQFSSLISFETVLQLSSMYEMRMENDSSGNVVYLGRSITPNAATSSKIWYIIKFTYDGSGFLLRVQLPEDGPGFLYVWDERATYF